MLRSLLIFVVSAFGAGLIRPVIMICLVIYGGEYLADTSSDGKKSIIRSIANQLPESVQGIINQVARGEQAYDFSGDGSDKEGSDNGASSSNSKKTSSYLTGGNSNFVNNVVSYYNKISGNKYEISDSLGYELYDKSDREFALEQGFIDSKKAAAYILANKIVGRKFFNREGKLPAGGNYFEYDLYKLTNQSEDRGTHRLVVDLKSSTALYTPDHYKTFIPLK